MNFHFHTGILIYLRRAPIIWYSKNHNTVKSSTFGLEIVAMRTRMDLTEGLHYKLSIMGILIYVPTLVFCDNNLVVNSTSVPTSTLAKKHLGICYYAAREAVAAGIHRIAHIAGDLKPRYVLNKILTAAGKMHHVERILY